MKKLLSITAVVLIAAFTLASCEKETGGTSGTSGSGGTTGGGGTSTPTTGVLQIVSVSSNPYKCYINNVYKCDIPGHGIVEYTLSPGIYSVRVLQKSGYLFYPTDETYTAPISAGYRTVITFPETKEE